MASSDQAPPAARGLSGLWRSRRFSFEVIVVFISLLVVTVMLVVWYTYRSNTRAIMALSEDLISEVNEAVIQKTTNYLQPAADMVELSTRLTAAGVREPASNEPLQSFMIEALHQYPQLTSFYFGNEQGEFIMHRREPDGTIATKTVHRAADAAQVQWAYRDAKGQVIRQVPDPADSFDPRARPWYQSAVAAHGRSWTDVYVFHTEQTPGVTAACPVYDAQGTVLGVFGLDIRLAEISEFLRRQRVGQTGLTFIINTKLELVAYPDAAKTVITETDGAGSRLRPARLTELQSPPVAASYQLFQEHRRPHFDFLLGGQRYVASYQPFPPAFAKSWLIGLVVPEDDFIGGVKRTNRITLLIAVAILALAIGCATVLSRKISRPIVLLTEETKKIRDFQLDGKIEIHTAIREIQSMTEAISSMKAGLQSFRRYVPATLVRQLIQTGEEARLGGQERELTIFFTDIRSFTTISEMLPPHEVMLHLSEYFQELTEILSAHKGTLDKYIGDSIMAFWGAPLPDDDHAGNACRAALAMQHRLAELNAKWKAAGRLPLITRIGIHSGPSIVGNIGSAERMNYTVFGDSVNLASRLEGVNKIYGTGITISAVTRERVADRFLCRPLDCVAVIGRTQSIMIYELVAEKGHVDPAQAALCARFTAALNLYRQRAFAEAAAAFAELAAKFPEDHPTQLYQQRCRELLQQPPGPEWTGVFYLSAK